MEGPWRRAFRRARGLRGPRAAGGARAGAGARVQAQLRRRRAPPKSCALRRVGSRAAACHLDVCGGCSWQELDYEAQLDAKTELVRESLASVSADSADSTCRGRCHRPQQFLLPQQDGVLVLRRARRGGGARPAHPGHVRSRLRSRRLLPDVGRVEPDRGARARLRAPHPGQPAYHSRRHTGFWRYLVVREAKTHRPDDGQPGDRRRAALPRRAELVAALARDVPRDHEHLCATSTRGRATIAVGEREELLHGAPEIEEQHRRLALPDPRRTRSSRPTRARPSGSSSSRSDWAGLQPARGGAGSLRRHRRHLALLGAPARGA